MRISILGAGPAGLYFALLMKKADPSHEVTVIERNPADATYGWGVVFSEETLGALRDADQPSYDRITESFAKWNAIDVQFRDQTVRSRGHVFSAISRKVLLAILQERCRELGVAFEFLREVTDPAELPEADLLVAADGVNSLIRRTHEDWFGPSIHQHGTKFVWFGADLAFKAFTFLFRENEHGLFQAHAYPFDASTSTFIVECPLDTWHRAGLDGASEEESIAYCETLFAEDLRGHKLMSNRSLWVSFVTLGNQTWSHGRTVLIGDAAHTAHFTIGSGTKLAMEDAVSLASSFQRYGSDVQAALVEYELDRQPVVERFQEAALDSAAYFENVRRYASFEPIQFAFNLLTRSGRITHLELERRDAAFVAGVDAWFAGRAKNPTRGDTSNLASPMVMAPLPLYAPFLLRGLPLSNRVVLAIAGEDRAEDGRPGQEHEARLVQAASAGAGLVLTEPVAVSAEGRITPGTPGLYFDDHGDEWAGIVSRADREAETLIGVRLVHAGRRGATRPRREGLDRPLTRSAWSLLAPSRLPYTPRSATPSEMERADMDQVRETFVRATERASTAGFDLLELDLSQGYLLASFLSPLSNRREDEYGGSREGRLRYPLEVLTAVRAAWPAGRPMVARLTVTDWARGGLTVDDGVAIAAALREAGCDAVHVSAGQTVAFDRPEYGRMYLVPAADRIRNEASIPVIAAGNITTRDEVNTIVAAGRADLCVLDRPLA
jgi:anthraniloyl-CoA monooxygenase